MAMQWIILGSSLGGILLLFVFLAMCFRVVVSTNDVHIVQSAKRTVSYGKDQTAGNVYWSWPSWIPVVGVKTINLPVSVFDVDLKDYDGYDKGRVPFKIDIMAFFRVEEPNIAAQRVHSFDELREQLHGILQGATRSILAKAEIEEILEERAKFGKMFTEEVNVQLKSWGVTNVKNIELMDIRDTLNSLVIQNIMAKKKSQIERESRIAVAENMRAAKEAEIVATREVELAQQQAQQQVGQRTAEQDKQVGIANELAKQEVLDQAAITATKDMAVKQVQEVRKAEIARAVQIVQADQKRQADIIAAEADRQVLIVNAEGQKANTVTVAEGNLTKAQMNAKGIEAEGAAKGSAEQSMLMAPVNAQLTLAKEVGTNQPYQAYLIEIRKIEAGEAIGIKQAEALVSADVKVIANTGDVASGITKAMDVLTSKGGTQIGAMLEALAQTPVGKTIIDRATGNET